jgi:hypothetical protein
VAGFFRAGEREVESEKVVPINAYSQLNAIAHQGEESLELAKDNVLNLISEITAA